MSRLFLAEAAPTHPHAFWRERPDSPGAAAAVAAVVAVGEAFEHSPTAPGIRLRLGDAQIDQRPCVRGHEIVLAPGIVTGDTSIRFVSGIDVVALRALGPQFSQVPDLFEAYCRAHGDVPPPDFLLALAAAVAQRWLVAR